jgi:hypothetical protein
MRAMKNQVLQALKRRNQMTGKKSFFQVSRHTRVSQRRSTPHQQESPTHFFCKTLQNVLQSGRILTASVSVVNQVINTI